jgi:methionine-rich copper-binding protein CopC
MKIRATLILAGLALLPLSAETHAHLTQALPADGSTQASAPDRFMLMFSEAAHLTALSIQAQGDTTAQKIEPLPKDISVHFMIPAPKLRPGVYTLKYRVVAADDNHVTSGTIRFTVSTPTQPSANPGK